MGLAPWSFTIMAKERISAVFKQISIISLSLALVGLSGCGQKPQPNTPQPKPKPDVPAVSPAKPSGKKQFFGVGTAPPGGAFFVVGGAMSEVLNEFKGDNNWEVTAEGTKGSKENIRRLAKGELDLAMANAAITYFAVRGEGGWDKKYPIRSVFTMAPNVAFFIAPAKNGIKKIADLKGKRVVCGPAGAGFEMFVKPLLEAHGVTYEDFTPLNNTQFGAVGMLADGSAAAAFLGGAVPTASITQACTSGDITFIPFEEDARKQLIKDYPFFHPITIPGGKYPKHDEPFPCLNVGSMIFITSADKDEETIYRVTRTIYENRAKVVEKHPAGKAINPKNAARNTGTPFHPGAIRFYKEIGIWDEGGGKK